MVVGCDLADFAFADAMMDSTSVAMMVAYRLCSVALDVIAVAIAALTCHHQLLILYLNSSDHYTSIYLDSEIAKKEEEEKKTTKFN